MENLVGRKVKCVKGFNGITINKIYEIVGFNGNHFTIIEDDGKKQNWNKSHLKSETHFILLPNETQFKQGDKVLVSNDRQEWHERVFVVEHNNLYQCEPLHENISNILTPWGHIKPYEEEIKVGDWVKRNNEIIKVYETPMKKDWIKITNPELIKLLNNELK